jgi:hypothetical protein
MSIASLKEVSLIFKMPLLHDRERIRLGDVAVFENRQPVTAAKFISKSSLFLQKFKDAGQAETEDRLCF